MNQKTHIAGGIILAAAAMIAGIAPLTASLIVFGGMFNDLDGVDIPWSSQGVHRKLFHNIFVIGLFLALSLKYPFVIYWALGMVLHNVMDMFSGAPVYVLWPLSRGGDHIGVGGWGVPNKSWASWLVGVVIAVLFSTGYLAVTGHLEDAYALVEKIWEYITP